jgi:hypothetical protein
LLSKGRFEFVNRGDKTREKEKESAFAYLSRSFFIRELKKEEPRNPMDYLHRQVKQRIFSYLSQWEKDNIQAFIRNASDEVQYLGWIEDASHKVWLRNKVLAHLWKPE